MMTNTAAVVTLLAALWATGPAVPAAAQPAPACTQTGTSGNDGLVKLVVDTARDVVVGATSVGPAGGEVLGLLALAVHARVPVATLDSMILAYPTFTRAVRDALADLHS